MYIDKEYYDRFTNLEDSMNTPNAPPRPTHLAPVSGWRRFLRRLCSDKSPDSDSEAIATPAKFDHLAALHAMNRLMPTCTAFSRYHAPSMTLQTDDDGEVQSFTITAQSDTQVQPIEFSNLTHEIIAAYKTLEELKTDYKPSTLLLRTRDTSDPGSSRARWVRLGFDQRREGPMLFHDAAESVLFPDGKDDAGVKVHIPDFAPTAQQMRGSQGQL